MLPTRTVRLLLTLCIAMAHVSTVDTRSDPSLFWATTAPPVPVASSETPTVAPVVTSSAPGVDLTPTLMPASTPVPAPSVDGGPVTTDVDPDKDFGPIAGGGGGRPTSPPPVPAPKIPTAEPGTPAAPVPETLAPVPETPTPVAETSPPFVETPAPTAVETLAPNTIPDPAPAPSGAPAAFDAPVETPVIESPDEPVVDNGSSTPSPDSDTVIISTDTAPVSVGTGVASDEAFTEEALSPNAAELLPTDEAGFVETDEQPEDLPEEPVVDGQADEAPELLTAADSSNSAPLPPSSEPAGPEATPAPQTTTPTTRTPVLPPPQVVTGTASNGSLTSTVIFNGANILTPHS